MQLLLYLSHLHYKFSAPSPSSSPLKSLPPSLASSPNTTVRLSCPSQVGNDGAISNKTMIPITNGSRIDMNIAKARKMLDMSQGEGNSSSVTDNAPNQVSVTPPSVISPVLPQIPTTVTIPTMMKQPMPLMPTVPLPQSSLNTSSSTFASTKVNDWKLTKVFFESTI